jgi:acyl transferase domain-containing protein/NAD(P)-dependent dehydrogenase (short-subunit alcohol dehydrogenase family)/acyl carrier protein
VSDFLKRIAKLSPNRLALLATELNTKLERLEQRAAEPIAVTGIGCRFPGGVNDTESFWRLLVEGQDAISEVPAGRWDINAFYDPDADAPGKMTTRWGGFLEDVELFDPELFGISPREAARMDPQQRLLLEVSWEALENAGQNPNGLAGSPTGVFVGLCNNDYFLMQFESGRGSIDAYVATGNAHSVASGRISYILGLQGPSVSVDTGCSASLVAVHLACQSLRSGECRMALAGGVNLILMPDTTIVLSKARMMSLDGRCKPFDASADGFVRSEGCGVIVLKRLSDARAEGDRILGVICGTASNQDGRSNGLTAPNGPSQVAVIREALANAGLQPHDIDFIEAHGTGTSLGDPIEAHALADVFGQGRTHSLFVGSVKSNFGHAESAAGIAGLIKAVLAVQHGIIPPTLHLKKLNPHIDWDGLAIGVPTVATSLHRERGQRIAGVSSFGFSGTNAHAIVSDPPLMDPVLDRAPENSCDPDRPSPLQLLPLAARTESALAELAGKYQKTFSEKSDLTLANACYTAGIGRAHFQHRLTVVAADLTEAGERLAEFRRGEKHVRIRTGNATRSTVPGVVFMFTGQGSQYVGMGRELYETQPVFRRELEKCAEILGPLLDKPLLEAIFADAELTESGSQRHLLDETQYTQPALFALEYGLAAMWRSWGVEPAAVLGHSIGEYVAACVAGIFSLEDGLRLIAERGRLMATLPTGGAMAVAFADEARVSEAIGPERTTTAIACINGPANTVISGECAALDRALKRLAETGIPSRRLVVSHAFHSPLMDPILDSFQRAAARVQYSEPLIAIVSNVTGQMAHPGLMSCPEYWRDHIRNAVRFADSIRALREAGQSIFLEIGPHPVLTGMAGMSVNDTEVIWAASLKRDATNWESILDGVSTLFVHGIDIRWAGLHVNSRPQRVTLPNYPFQRHRYWLEQTKAASSEEIVRSKCEPGNIHPFLGKRLDSPAIGGTVFEIQIGAEHPAFLDDHRIFGRLIMPSPAYIEMALAGATEAFGLGQSKPVPCEVANLIIREALFLSDEDRIQLILEKGTELETGFRICSKAIAATTNNSAPWRTHASGRVRIGAASLQSDSPVWKRDEAWTRCSEEIDATSFYDSLTALGLDFGDRFRGIARIRRRDGEAVAEIRLPEALAEEADRYRVHPALLDSCFHLLGAALPADRDPRAYLLIGLERFTLLKLPPGKFWNHTILHPGDASETFGGDIWLYDDHGQLLAEIIGLQLKRATGAAMKRVPDTESNHLFYELAWREQEQPTSRIIDSGSDRAADFFPSPRRLAERARNELQVLAQSEKLHIYRELNPRLEALSTAFINRACFRMGWSPLSGERFMTQELAEQLAIVPAQHRLFERLIGILAEDGSVRPESDGWIVVKPMDAPSSDLQSEAVVLSEQFPACSAEIILTARCAEQLDQVLRGACDPLQLLFPSGDFDTADALYRRSPFARALNTVVRHVVVGATQELPKNRTLRILEIGAGTGGTTSFLLPHLPPEHTSYSFTDVSLLFLTRARDEFRDYPFASFELLDIEKPPGAQGFGERSFDLIIAANALHATRDLQKTLRNAVSLLARGGLLVLLEATAQRRWVDLTFGLTDGWWRFDDSTLRRDCPLISAEQWRALFERADLEDVHSTASLGGDADFVGQAILIGRKPVASDQANLPTVSSSSASGGFWVVLRDTKGIADELALRISQQGEECLVVSQGRDYKFAEGCAELDPLNPADFTRLFLDAFAARIGPLKGVLNLWPIDDEIAAETTPAQWESAQRRVGGGALHVTQAFLALQPSRISNGARVWFATRGAQVAQSDAKLPGRFGQPIQALVWGLARVISLEHPGQFGAVIDLDFSGSSRESAAAIWREITEVSGEDAVVYRRGRRLVPRVVRSQELQSRPLTLRRDGSYLITGGLGGLGLQIADWMAALGAGQIVLLSRRDFPEHSLWTQLPLENTYYATVQNLLAAEKRGTRITVAKGDVADEKAMASLLQQIGQTGLPLRGIVHAAVDMTNRSIGALDLESFQRMCRAKALGAWVLHQLTLDLELDFFVFFSSTTALWGASGLGHYAAANQEIDLLAHWRREHNLPALSVQWGTWHEMRVASDADKDRFEQSGLQPMPVAQALAALERLIVANRTLATVASVDWSALRAVYEARRARPLFAETSSSARTKNGAVPVDKPTGSEVRRLLQSASPARRRDILIAHLRSQVGDILGFNPSREIALEQGLFDMGMDSLMAVELKGRLERSLGVSLPATFTFNYPTINALTNYLLSDILGFDLEHPTKDGALSPAPVELDSVTESFDALTESQISDLLLKKLEEIE